MYGGRPGYGGQLPYSLGERSNAPFNLSGVSEAGYGPYLGNFFEDLQRIAGKVGVIAGEVGDVVGGRTKIATIPTDRATITFPTGSNPFAASVPLLPLAIGAGVLFFLVSRRGRR